MYVLEVKRNYQYFGPFPSLFDAHQWAERKGMLPMDYTIHRMEKP